MVASQVRQFRPGLSSSNVVTLLLQRPPSRDANVAQRRDNIEAEFHDPCHLDQHPVHGGERERVSHLRCARNKVNSVATRSPSDRRHRRKRQTMLISHLPTLKYGGRPANSHNAGRGTSNDRRKTPAGQDGFIQQDAFQHRVDLQAAPHYSLPVSIHLGRITRRAPEVSSSNSRRPPPGTE